MKQESDLMREIGEFILTSLLLGIIFGIALTGGISGFNDLSALRDVILQSIIVVVISFVLHEVAHRFVARRYGHKATFRMWFPGLIIAAAASLGGWIFAAPGAVHIEGIENNDEGRKKLGISALAGPVMNMLITVVLVVVTTFFISYLETLADTGIGTNTNNLDFIGGVLVIGITINSWLAIFNLIPFGSFDGFKVFSWSKKAWGIAFCASLVLYVAIYLVQTKLWV